MKTPSLFIIAFLCSTVLLAQCKVCRTGPTPDSISIHKVVLDGSSKLISWMGPPDKAFDKVLRLRWEFIKTKVPASPGPAPRSLFLQYYFYCAFKDSVGLILPDSWMNDVGEKIPNWFESARLYYAYTGDASVMNLAKGLIDYSMQHGMSPSDFAWPNFPYTTTNAGDTEFRGFTSAKRFALHEIQVDHAAEMGLTFYRMYLFSGEVRYRDAAIKVANTLVSKIRIGNREQSPWPYRVILKTGVATAEYGANWTGAFLLFDNLIKAKVGDVKSYISARDKTRDFLINYPVKTGFWTDGHSDANVQGNTYKSNLSNSNFTLTLFDHPELDPNWKNDVPGLIQWTEDNFIFRSAPGEPSTQWGANIVGEQDDFMFKMDYQTARYAAECARWYAVSGDPVYREKAYRSLNWVTYCMDSTGKVFESPLSKDILSWWSDSYGEGPRMFYHAFAAIPEWAPKRENHILYSEGVLKEIVCSENKIEYLTSEDVGTEFLKVRFKPTRIVLNGTAIKERTNSNVAGYALKSLGEGDYSLIISRLERREGYN